MTADRQHSAADGAILTVCDLRVALPAEGRAGLSRRTAEVVRGVDLTVRRGRTLALVGESGAGKTTAARAVLRLLPEAHVSGRVTLDGCDVLTAGARQLRAMRRRTQMIFQDPAGSLDPRMTAGRIVAEPLLAHRIGTRRQRRLRAAAMLDRVGLAADSAARYPHEFSGGQRQRIAIARAIAPQPDLIICDEPVSSLDVSIRAQILNLLADLQEELGLSYLLIAHDLAVVERFADEVAVMYEGRVVETGSTQDVLAGDKTRHPYTESLISSVLTGDPTRRHAP